MVKEAGPVIKTWMKLRDRKLIDQAAKRAGKTRAQALRDLYNLTRKGPWKFIGLRWEDFMVDGSLIEPDDPSLPSQLIIKRLDRHPAPESGCATPVPDSEAL